MKISMAACVILQCAGMYAESRYTYDIKKDLVTGSLSLGIFIAPFFIGGPAPGTVFNKNEVNSFDRTLFRSYNKRPDMTSKIGTYGLMALPVLPVIGNIKTPHAVITYGIMYAEAFFLTYGTKELLKHMINRNRPYSYFGSIPPGKEDDYDNSFPSGHTALAFMAAGFLTSTFSTEYPRSRWKAPVIAAGYSIAAAIGAGRILSGSHFLTDVIAGAAIGSLYGYLIPYLHLRKRIDEKITISPMVNGFYVSVAL
ncbi:MAG: phosphatase PAP2 family protein [Treponema sp.]|nr:phosphatase PAP2 family protein [Treponema sp.]